MPQDNKFTFDLPTPATPSEIGGSFLSPEEISPERITEIFAQQVNAQDQQIVAFEEEQHILAQDNSERKQRLADNARNRSRSGGEIISDFAVSAGIKGAIGVGEAAYGLADVASRFTQLSATDVAIGVAAKIAESLDMTKEEVVFKSKTSLDRVSDDLLDLIGVEGSMAQQFDKARQVVDTEFLSDPLQYSKEQVTEGSQQRATGKQSRVDAMIADGHSELVAKMSDEFDTAVETVGTLIDNPTAAVDMALESLPNMLLSGAVGKVATGSLVKDMSAAEAKKYLTSEAGKKAATDIGTKAGLATIAVTEGMSNGVSAKAGVLNLSHDDLMKSSPMYAELIGSGTDKEQAKQIVSDKVFDVTAAISGTVGALASKLTGAAKFEGNLFNPSSKVAGLVTNAIKGGVTEGAEELIQGTAGTLAQNIAEQKYSDKDKDLTSGLGEGAGSGLVVGSLSGATVGSASSAGGAIAEVVKGSTDVVTKGATKVAKTVKDAKAVKEAVRNTELSKTVRDVESKDYDPVQAFDVAAHKSQLPKEAADIPAHKAELQTHLDNITKKALATLESAPKDIESPEYAEVTAEANELIARMTEAEARLDAYKDTGTITAGTADNKITEAIEGNAQSKDELLGSVPKLSNEQLTTLVDSETTTPDEKVRITSHLKTREAIKAVEELAVPASMSKVHTDIVEGGEGFRGIKQYQSAIETYTAVGDTANADIQLKEMLKFASEHKRKVLAVTKAFDTHVKSPNSPQALKLSEGVQAQYNIKIHKGSNQSGLIDRMKLEVKALESAYKESRHVIKLTGVDTKVDPIKPTTETSKADVQAVDAKQETAPVQEAVKTSEPIKTENAVKIHPTLAKNFDVKSSSKKLLQSVEGLFTKVLPSTTQNAGLEAFQQLNDKQKVGLESVQRFEKKFSSVITKSLVKIDEKFASKDFTQYLLDDKGQMSDNTKSAISLVTMNWLGTQASNTISNDKEAVNNLLGLSKEDATPTVAHELLANVGVTRVNLAETLGQNISKAIGIKSKSDADGDAQARLELSLGQLAVHNMVVGGLLEATNIQNAVLDLYRSEDTISNDPQAYTSYVRAATTFDTQKGFNVPSKAVRQVIDNLKASDGVMDELFGIASHETKPSLKAPTDKSIPEMVKGSINKVPQKIHDAIKIHQARPMTNKSNVAKPFLFLSDENQALVSGAKPNYETETHHSTWESVKAVNESIARSIDHFKSHHDTTGEKEFFFTHFVSKQMRLFMNSNTVNPQSNKVHRHLMGYDTDNVTLDPSDVNQMVQFKTAIAESLGVSVDKMLSQGAIEALGEKLADPIIQAGIDAITQINDDTYDVDHIDTLQQAIVDAVKVGGENVYSLDGLTAMAAYQESNGKPFQANIFREVDGVTNGVIIGLFQLAAAGDFNSLSKKLERGGFFFDDTQNLAEWAQKTENNDTYEDMAESWVRQLDITDGLVDSDTKIKKKQLAKDMGMLRAAHPDTRLILKDLIGQIARKVAKSPVMITSYGSGIGKVRNQFAETMLAGFYSKVTKLALKGNSQELERMSNNMSVLIGSPVEFTTDNTLTTSLTKSQENKFKDLTNAYYGSSLQSALEETFEDFIANRTEINTALRINFEAFNIVYKRTVAEQEAKEGRKISSEMKLKIVRQLQGLVPGFKSPMSDNLDDSIVVMKTEKTRLSGNENAVEMKFNTRAGGKNITVNKDDGTLKTDDITGRVANRNAEGKVIKKGDKGYGFTYPKGKNNLKSYISEENYTDGGVSGAILGIHSMDAATMYGLLEQYAALNVHDAAAFNLLEVMEGSEALNKSFLDVMSGYNLREEVQVNLERAINLLGKGKHATADMLQLQEVMDTEVFKNNEDSPLLQNYLDTFASKTLEANALRDEVLSKLVNMQQYNAGEGGQYFTNRQDTSNLSEKAETKHIDNEIKEFLGSANRNIDPDNFGARTAVAVTAMNTQQTFDVLDSVGNVKASTEHKVQLTSVLTNVVNSVLEPIKLHMRTIGNETYGATRGQEVFINEGMGTLSNGTQMSAQEVFVHEIVHNVTRQGVEGTSWAKRELLKLFNLVESQIKAEDFLNTDTQGNVLDLNGNVITVQSAGYASELAAATERYDYIFNNAEGKKGKNAYLHEFVALGITNEAFNKKLATLDGFVKKESFWTGDVASTLLSIFQRISDWISGRITHTSNITADKKLMVLAEQLAGIDYRKKSTIYSTMDKVTDVIHSKLATFAAEPLMKLANSRMVQGSKYKVVRQVGNIVSKIPYTTIEAYSEVMEKVARRLGVTKDNIISSLVTEVIGHTKDNSNFHTLLRESHKLIDQARTHIKTNVIKQLNDNFLTDISKQARKAITNVVIKTDMNVLVQSFSWKEIRNFVSDSVALDVAIDKQVKLLKQFKGREHYFRKMSESMGTFMATGEHTQEHTPINALTIAREFGTDNVDTLDDITGASTIIDTLASLYALRATDDVMKTHVANLMTAEFTADSVNNGITFLTQVHADSKARALQSIFRGNPSSVIKGYTKEIYNANISVMVAPLSEEATLLREGYQREATPLKRDPMNPSVPMYRYVSKDNLLNTYEAGIASTTNKTAKGTDLTEVYAQQKSTSPVTEGIQEGAKIFNAKMRGMQSVYSSKDTSLKGVAMQPIFNEDGNVTQYRYLMNEANKVLILEKDGNFDTVMGAMEANTEDKINTDVINNKLVQLAKDTFDEKYSKDPENFVTIGKSATTERNREIYRMLPYATRQEIKRVWGTDNMRVPAELVILMFGQRKMSAANTILKNPAFDALNVQVLKTLGVNLGKGVRTIENVWQEIVGITKDVIVIKSGLVLLGNVLSNMAILKVSGISAKDIIKDHGIAVTYAKEYQSKTAELDALKRELRVNPTATERRRKEVLITRLENDLKENPVKELIDAGVYQSIIEDVATEDDQYSYKSKLQEWITPKYVAEGKVPQLLTDIGNNLIISHETQLYKSLRDATQLSDFIARYTLHQHNLKNDMTKEESFQDIVDTFVNYDLPTHKGIQYANDMGFLMFTKFFVRIQKIIYKLATKNTGNFITLMLLQNVFDKDIEDIADSFASPDNMVNKLHNPMDVINNIMDVPLTSLIGAGL